MRKFILLTAIIVFISGAAIASVNVMSDGTNLGPAQDINFTGGTVTGKGPIKTVDLTTITSLTVDGTIYTATITADGGIVPGSVTIDPCTTLPAGSIFINGTTGAPCFCNKLGVDLSLYNGTSACF